VTTRAPKTRTAPVPEEDILDIATAEPPVEEAEERRTLFKIDGVEYTVPKVVDERMVFLAFDTMRTEGSMFGAMYLTELILGEDQYRRIVNLLKERRITREQYDNIAGRVNNVFFHRDKQTPDSEEAGEEGKASTASSSA
jgi:hypothetical protein